MQVCQKCGKENLVYVTKCQECYHPLDQSYDSSSFEANPKYDSRPNVKPFKTLKFVINILMWITIVSFVGLSMMLMSDLAAVLSLLYSGAITVIGFIFIKLILDALVYLLEAVHDIKTELAQIKKD